MAANYTGAKRGGRSGAQARSRSGDNSNSASAGKWFSAGLICGVVLSFMTWLSTQPGENLPPASGDAAEATVDDTPRPRFDFYTLLPEQQVKFDPAPTQTAGTPVKQPQSAQQYLLQAGSFKALQDADRRRAQLILLGLDAKVEETESNNGRWFRVYVGPYETRSKTDRARALTAQQGIDTLVMKRPRTG